MAAPRLIQAAVSGVDRVTLTFDQDMENVDGSALLSATSYSFDGGLRSRGVSLDPSKPWTVIVHTTPQVDDRPYIVFVSTAVLSVTLEAVDTAQASCAFTGASSVSVLVVQDLVARSNLSGRKIDLYWNQPAGVAVGTVAIIRRERAWVFDTTDDDCTVVYNGSPFGLVSDPIGGFDKTFTDTGLREMTYYYYTVVISTAAGAALGSMSVGPESRTYALSTSSLDSKEWLQKKGMIPRHWFTADARSPANYTLDKLLIVVGAWLDLMRSHMKAGLLLGKWNNAPFSALGDLNRSIGFEPEGESYDFDTLRRTLLQMSSILAIKGRKAAVEMAVASLVEWDCEVQEFGLYEKRRIFGTYNPDTTRHPVPPLVTSTLVADVGFGALREPLLVTPWAKDFWVGARLQDGLGNWFDVVGSSSRSFTLDTGDDAAEAVETTSVLSVGGHTVVLDHIHGLVVGQRVCIKHPSSDVTSVLCIVAIDGPTRTITFWNRTSSAFPVGSLVTWRIRAPQLQYVGEVLIGALNSLQVNFQGGVSGWAANQWVGFSIRDSSGVVHSITSSGGGSFTFNDGLVIPGGTFQLALSFSGANPVGAYDVFLGDRPTLYNPMWDRGLRGTRFDPFFYMVGGYEGSLRGAWGPCDLGVYISTPTATVARGRVSAKTGATITDSSANYGVDSLVGMMVNPNQNQTKLFLVLSNTANTITLAGDASRVARVGQGYVVFTPRNAQRYSRLQARIGEFVEDGLRPHILFL